MVCVFCAARSAAGLGGRRDMLLLGMCNQRDEDLKQCDVGIGNCCRSFLKWYALIPHPDVKKRGRSDCLG
jgi:hypothetical protein